jgi:ADP-L-glycero-D-manno-heptose 6-epimerase
MGWAFSVVMQLHITRHMILVTGGAGFIGSNLHAALAAEGQEVVICDWLGHEGAKWRNFLHHPPAAIIRPEALDDYLAHDMKLTAIVHLGAISETTARDGDLVWESNVTLSQKLWTWCAERRVRFIYASSAATYGNGGTGFDDDMSLDALRKLKPLNLYGWSKHAFDLWVAKQAAEHAHMPPNWAGVKFFNVYGPNEYHKGKMISVVKVKHDEIATGAPVRLFKSDRADIADGEQKRDFIHVDDVVAALKFLLSAPHLAGIYNLGTGTARTYADLARAVCAANGVAERIEYIDMPESLRGQYQSFTEAPMARLRGIGFNHEFLTLEQGVDAYIKSHLLQADPYR